MNFEYCGKQHTRLEDRVTKRLIYEVFSIITFIGYYESQDLWNEDD